MAKSCCSRQAKPNTKLPIPSIQAPRSSSASQSSVVCVRVMVSGNVATRGFHEKIHFAAIRPTTDYTFTISGLSRALQCPGEPAYAIAHLDSVECRKPKKQPARVWRREGKTIEGQRFDARLGSQSFRVRGPHLVFQHRGCVEATMMIADFDDSRQVLLHCLAQNGEPARVQFAHLVKMSAEVAALDEVREHGLLEIHWTKVRPQPECADEFGQRHRRNDVSDTECRKHQLGKRPYEDHVGISIHSHEGGNRSTFESEFAVIVVFDDECACTRGPLE